MSISSTGNGIDHLRLPCILYRVLVTMASFVAVSDLCEKVSFIGTTHQRDTTRYSSARDPVDSLGRHRQCFGSLFGVVPARRVWMANCTPTRPEKKKKKKKKSKSPLFENPTSTDLAGWKGSTKSPQPAYLVQQHAHYSTVWSFSGLFQVFQVFFSGQCRARLAERHAHCRLHTARHPPTPHLLTSRLCSPEEESLTTPPTLPPPPPPPLTTDH